MEDELKFCQVTFLYKRRIGLDVDEVDVKEERGGEGGQTKKKKKIKLKVFPSFKMQQKVTVNGTNANKIDFHGQ